MSFSSAAVIVMYSFNFIVILPRRLIVVRKKDRPCIRQIDDMTDRQPGRQTARHGVTGVVMQFIGYQTDRRQHWFSIHPCGGVDVSGDWRRSHTPYPVLDTDQQKCSPVLPTPTTQNLTDP